MSEDVYKRQAKAVQELMQELKKTGTTKGFMDRMLPFDQFNRFIGLPDIRRIERDYASGREVSEEV